MHDSNFVVGGGRSLLESSWNVIPVVSYGAEAWTLTKKEEQAWLIFERKYLEEYMVLNMKMGNGKVGRIEN